MNLVTDHAASLRRTRDLIADALTALDEALAATTAELRAKMESAEREYEAAAQPLRQQLAGIDYALNGDHAPLASIGRIAGQVLAAQARPLGADAIWRPEPPRGQGTAISRRPKRIRGFDQVVGMRRLTIDLLLQRGELGVTAIELAELIKANAEEPIKSRFGALNDQVKNAADSLYYLREAQHELGLIVERCGKRWRLRLAGANHA